MFEQIFLWDVWFMHLINVQWAHPILDHSLSIMADFNLLKWVLIPLVLGTLIWGGFRARAMWVLMLLCLVIGDAGINWAIKKGVSRPRPHETVEGLRKIERHGWGINIKESEPREVENGRSMTSGHVCNNIALGILVTLFYRPWGWLIWIWSLTMAYSRIYTTDHYVSDAVVSFFVATAYTFAIVWGASLLWTKIGQKYWLGLLEKHPKLVPDRD